MLKTSVASLQQETEALESEGDNVLCPPHHWMIVDRREDGYIEESWECRRCGDLKFVRTPTWATNGRRMSNNSTWTPEDTILGGGDEDELL
jgi:hypothetical protein